MRCGGTSLRSCKARCDGAVVGVVAPYSFNRSQLYSSFYDCISNLGHVYSLCVIMSGRLEGGGSGYGKQKWLGSQHTRDQVADIFEFGIPSLLDCDNLLGNLVLVNTCRVV